MASDCTLRQSVTLAESYRLDGSWSVCVFCVWDRSGSSCCSGMVMLVVGTMFDLDVNEVEVIIRARLGSEVSEDVSDDVDEFLDGEDGL